MKAAELDKDLVIWIQKGQDTEMLVEALVQALIIRSQMKMEGITFELA